MSKNAWQNILTSILVACALLVTGAVVHREFFRDDGSKPVGHVDEWKTLAKDRPPYLGTPDAPVQIIVFSDYQCPFCKDIDQKLVQLSGRKDLRFSVHRYEMPLTNIHPHAFKAAVTAKCAEMHGVRSSFQTVLFQNADRLGSFDPVDAARKNGVRDLVDFARCLNGVTAANEVRKDMKVAERLEITSVPVVIINGDMYSGTLPTQRLRALIQDGL